MEKMAIIESSHAPVKANGKKTQNPAGVSALQRQKRRHNIDVQYYNIR